MNNKAYHGFMIIDMHIHTRFSPCSSIRIRQLVRKAQERELDGVCITDHDTIDSLSFFKNQPEVSGICIIVGIEYTTQKGDFLVFGPIEQIPKCMDAKNLLKWVQKEGGVAIPAHPFRKDRPVDPNILRNSKIIEGLNGRNLTSENKLCREWILKNTNGVKTIGGSDAHTLDEVGRIVTVFEKNIYSVEDLINELQYGNYSPLQRYPSLSAILGTK
jgi:predicted metal-dependent phosphoesterase TrpH